MRRAEAVRPGVAAADDHDVLPLGVDGRRAERTLLHQVGRLQVLEGHVDAVELAPGHGEVARQGGAAGQHDRIEGGPHLGCGPHRDVGCARRADAALLPWLRRVAGRSLGTPAHRRGAHEGHALGLHLGQAAVQDRLLHLELGDAVAQEAAGLLRPLEDGHQVPGPHQLLGGGQAGGSGPHHGDGLARADGRDLRGHPAFVPGPLDNLEFDPLNGDRVLVDPEHAGGLAGCRTETPGELGEVVGGVQALHGPRPVVAVDQVVPLRDQVAERAAVVAERNATVHAPRALLLGLVLAEGLVDLPPIAQPHRHGAPTRQSPRVLHEARLLTHVRPP